MTEESMKLDLALDLYTSGPQRLEEELAGLPEAALDLAPAPGEWSIRQIVHHIADGDALWQVCIKAALGNSEGWFSLQWYWDRPQVEWSEAWHYADRLLEPSLLLLRANRQHIQDLLRRTPDAWEKTIFVRGPGGEEERVTVGDVITMQAGHVFEHIEDIRSLRSIFQL